MTDGYRIIGAEMSPYSVKVRSYFRYKGIPFQWIPRNAASQALRSCFDAVGAFFAARFVPRISATVISTLLARRLGSLARRPHEAELNSSSSCAFRLASSPRRARHHRPRTSCSGRSKSASGAVA